MCERGGSESNTELCGGWQTAGETSVCDSVNEKEWIAREREMLVHD